MKALPVNAGRILLLVSLILLAGCQSMAPNPVVPTAAPTTDLNVVRTEAVGTAVAAITTEAQNNPTATMEPTKPQDTPTLAPTVAPTAVPDVPTLTPVATATKTRVPVVAGSGGIVPTKTVYTDSAKLTSQSPADNKTFKAGDAFDISWSFQNTGLRAWNTQFYFNYVSGPDSPKGGKNRFIASKVAVGDTVTFTLDMVAPSTPGIYVVKWGLINDDGVTFYPFYYSFAVAK